MAVSVQAVSDDNAPPTGKDGKRTTLLDDKLVDTVRALPGVQSVRRNVAGTATLAGLDGIPIGKGWQNIATNFQPDKDGYDERYPLMEGRGPAAANEIALDEATAKAAGHKVGDSVRFATDGPVLTKKLVGIVTTEDPQVTAGGSLALFDTATAQKLYLHPGQFDELVVGAAPGTDQQALTAKVREVLPKDRAEATSGTALAAEQSRMITEQNKSLSQTLLVFAGIALFVGIFIIANTFTMLISQRSREIALLRAVGASHAAGGALGTRRGGSAGPGLVRHRARAGRRDRRGPAGGARRQRRGLPGRAGHRQPDRGALRARCGCRGDRTGRLAAVPQGGEDRPGGGAQHRRGAGRRCAVW